MTPTPSPPPPPNPKSQTGPPDFYLFIFYYYYFVKYLQCSLNILTQQFCRCDISALPTPVINCTLLIWPYIMFYKHQFYFSLVYLQSVEIHNLRKPPVWTAGDVRQRTHTVTVRDGKVFVTLSPPDKQLDSDRYNSSHRCDDF